MTKHFAPLALFIFFTFSLNAQSVKINNDAVKPYGKVDTAELKMKSCSFEKDAKAMILFDKGQIIVNQWGDMVFVRHKRIKIFDKNATGVADIKLPFIDRITDISAETVNLDHDTIQYAKIEPALFFKQKIESNEKALTFTFPNVKNGSVIEMQYTWKVTSEYYVPDWFFQSELPTAYSEISLTIDDNNSIRLRARVSQAFARDTTYSIDHNTSTVHIKVMKNIHSYVDEPYMTPEYDNIQRLEVSSYKSSWFRLSSELADDADFGLQLKNKLPDEKLIIQKADSVKDKDTKIDSIFTFVKNRMTWNRQNSWYTKKSIQNVWKDKTGSSTEINLSLCRLLIQAGIEAFPMLVSTSDYGIVDPNDISISQFNKTVVCVPIDSVRYYVLDASDKHNSYNLIPFDLISTYGLVVAIKSPNYSLIKLVSIKPAQQSVFIDATITADGKMTGTADISSYGYNRYAAIKQYKELGEKKYIDRLKDDDNNLKITALKMDSMNIDSLPLMQHLAFDLSLPASDDKYIYFNTNVFSLGVNPFLSETRYSNIDLKFNQLYYITGKYKIPAGYQVDALPKNSTMVMEDKSINIKRVIGEQDGVIILRYVITRKRFFYTKDEYMGLHNFFKKMYEMLNEQIVLKKS